MTLTDDYTAHHRRSEHAFLEHNPSTHMYHVKYEAMLDALEAATRRKPSEGIHEAAWHFLQDFEPQARYARLFLDQTFYLLWGAFGVHAPGAGNSDQAERALGERGRTVLIRLLFNADFRHAGRPTAAPLSDEIAGQARTLWPVVREAFKAARRELRRDPESPILDQLITTYCAKLSFRDRRALTRQLRPVDDGHRSRAVDEGADLILGAALGIAPRRVRALRAPARRSA